MAESSVDQRRTPQTEEWRLVERYVDYDYRKGRDWRLVFKRGAVNIEISVSEDAWREFDGL